jgi:hypothetical protein
MLRASFPDLSQQNDQKKVEKKELMLFFTPLNFNKEHIQSIA